MKVVLIFFLIVAEAMVARAQTSGTKPVLEVVVLGSGGPRAFGRAGSSYIVLIDRKARILLDAGPGAFVRIGELHIDLRQVDIVLLTHLHIDHSGDLAAFFNARALTSDGPIRYRVFGPDAAGLFPKTSRFVDLLVGENGLFSYQKTFGAQETFEVRDLAIDLNTGITKFWMRTA
jgi:ribonuclease BN (tRNA processing enzyme)